MLRAMHPPLPPYALAFLAWTIALLFTWLLQPIMSPTIFALFYPAVMVSALEGGLGPGLLVVTLATLATKYFFLEPIYSLAFTSANTLFRFIVLVLVALMICLLSTSLRTAKRRTEVSLLKLQKSEEQYRRIAETARENEERYRLLAEALPQFVWTADADGKTDYCNQHWYKYTGLTAERSLGDGWTCVLHPGDRQRTITRWQNAAETGERYEIEYRIKPATGGQYRWHLASVGPIRNGNGEIIKWVGTAIDIDDRKRTEDSLRDALQRLNFHVENSPLAVIEWNCEFRISRWSRTAEQIFGWTLEEVRGKHPDDWRFVFAEDVSAVNEIIARLLDGSQQQNLSFNRNYRKDGSVVHCEWYHSALFDESGNLVSVLSHVLDVSDRERAVAALRENEQRLKLALETAQLGSWQLDLIANELHSSERCRLNFGLPPDADLSYQRCLELIHPEDRHSVEEAVEQAIATQSNYEVQYRNIWPDGSIHWIVGRGRGIYASDGTPLRLVGVCLDISDQKLAEEALRTSENLYRTLSEAVPDFIWSCDREGKTDFVNSRWLDYAGMTAEELNAGGLEQVYHPEDFSRVMQQWNAARQTREPFEVECRYRRKDGVYRWFMVRAVPLYDDGGTIIKWIGTTTDIHKRKQTEEALRQSEERLHVALKHSPISVFNQDRELRYTWKYNSAFGYETEAVLGKRDVDLLPKDDAEVLTGIKRQVLKTGVGTRQEVKITRQRKDWYYDLTVEPLRDANDEIIGVTCAAIDISERKQAEIALQKSETLLNTLLASSPVGMAFIDHDLRYIHLNEALAAINGVPLSEHLGRTVGDILPDWAPQIASVLQQVMQTKEPLMNREISGETHPPGVHRHCLVSHYPICLPNGEVLGVGVTSLDITELKRVEQALRESESRFRRMADCAPVFIWMSGLDGHCTYFNQLWLDFVGQTLEEALTIGWPEGIHPDDKETCLTTYRKAFNARDRFQIEYRHRRKDGEYRWLLDVGVPLFKEDGSFVGYIGSGIDITDRKAAERRQQLLMELNDALRTLWNSQEIMWTVACYTGQHFGVTRCAYGEIDVTQEYATIICDFSHGADSIVGRHRLLDFGTPLVAEAKQGKTLVIEDVYIDPRTVDSITAFDAIATRASITVPLLKQGRLVALFILHHNQPRTWSPEDVKLAEEVAERTWAALEKARVEKALRQSEARFQRLATNVPGVICRYVLYPEGFDAMPYISPSCRNIFGLEAQTIQENVDALWTLVHPDDVQLLRDAIAISAQTEQPLQWEGRYVMPSGCMKWIQIAYRPEKQIDGTVIWDGLLTDITNLKEAAQERERLLAREQAAREEAEAANRIKDEFLAVLSHELRSPLNPILGWTTLLRSRKFDEKAADRALEIIERNAKLQTQLIEDLLDVSRILRGKMALNVAPVNLVTTIEAALETVRLAAQVRDIQIQTVFEPDMGQVAGDANRLQQVVWNLLSNAVKFTPQGGNVEIRLSTYIDLQDSPENPDSIESNSQSNNPKSKIQNLNSPYAQIQVKDNGKGISAVFLPYIFEYFRQENSTTTRKFGGLGLGLAIVRHLTELHGGYVFAESPGEGLGAIFTVRLPLMVAHPEVMEEQMRCDRAADLTGLHILVVDDEADIRELVAFVLQEFGAQVTVAASAEEALMAFSQSVPDVLLSDIGMPEVDGYMLMRQVRMFPPERGGEVPAIALTAYAGEYNQQQAIAAGFGLHIAKPVEPEELVKAIARLVGRA